MINEMTARLWKTYKASTKGQFAQRLRRLLEWGEKSIELDSVKDKLRSLKDKSSQLKMAYEMPGCYRTSNQIDR